LDTRRCGGKTFVSTRSTEPSLRFSKKYLVAEINGFSYKKCTKSPKKTSLKTQNWTDQKRKNAESTSIPIDIIIIIIINCLYKIIYYLYIRVFSLFCLLFLFLLETIEPFFWTYLFLGIETSAKLLAFAACLRKKEPLRFVFLGVLLTFDLETLFVS